jgi:uncharacterized membrane protein HdeD (DUF308 family)
MAAPAQGLTRRRFFSLPAEARRNASAGALIVLLGAALALIPVGGREASVQLTGLILLGAALLELFVGLTSSRASVRTVEILLSCVTLSAVLLILLRPEAYPLTIIAALCLAVRGVGATVASFEPDGVIRGWVLARGLADLILTTILMVGAPLAAIISVISGVPWPPRGAAVLTNFLAVSTIATGLSLLALSLRNRSRRDP